MIEPISTAIAETAKEVIAESLKETAELVVKESPVESMIGTIENESLESLKAQNIETINKSLEDTIHPETNVPFERKFIETDDGKKVEGVFPNFKESRIFEVNLPENMLQETDKKQFSYCDEKLKESFDKGSINTESFSERQLEQLQHGDKPEGFTWHHNEIKGRMELVKSDVHQATAHTGGKSIWGGGKENR